MARTAKLELDGKTIELPVIEGTEGERAIDIQPLRAQTGYITYDDWLRQHRLLPERHHLHRRREGHPALPRHPHRAAGRDARPSSRRPS